MKTIKEIEKEFDDKYSEALDAAKNLVSNNKEWSCSQNIKKFYRSEIEQILEELPTETLKVSDCELGYVFEDGSKKTNDKLKEHIEKLKQ